MRDDYDNFEDDEYSQDDMDLEYFDEDEGNSYSNYDDDDYESPDSEYDDE